MLENSHIEPAYLPINPACTWSGLSRSELYRRLAAGQVRAIKSGRTTLIDVSSLKAHLAALPQATFRQSNAA